MTIILAVGLWATVQQWGMPLRLFRPNNLVATREESLPIDIISAPLHEILIQNIGHFVNFSDAEARAFAEGFAETIHSQNRMNEILPVLKGEFGEAAQTAAFGFLTIYLARVDEKANLSDEIYDIIVRTALSYYQKTDSIVVVEPEWVREFLYRTNLAALKVILKELAILVANSQLAALPYNLTVQITHWFEPEYQELILFFLNEISEPLLVNEFELWESSVHSKISGWTNYQVVNSYDLGDISTAFYFQMRVLRPAMLEMKGQSFYVEYSHPSKSSSDKARLIHESLATASFRENLLAKEVAKMSPDDVFDHLLEIREAEFRDFGEIFEIFLRRNSLSDRGLQMVEPWIRNPEATKIASFYWALHKFGESGLKALPLLLSTDDPYFGREKSQGIALLAQNFSLKKLWVEQKWNVDQGKRMVSALSLNQTELDKAKLLDSILDLILSPEGLYDADKDREITDKLTFLVADLVSSTPPEQLELLVTAAKKVFALPPDATTEEALLRLINQLSLVLPNHPEVEKMKAELT